MIKILCPDCMQESLRMAVFQEYYDFECEQCRNVYDKSEACFIEASQEDHK